MTRTDRAIALANLVLRLGEVERITLHPDGRRRESVTTHSLMLAIVAAELAPPHLDLGEVMAMALVHDLVEAYAGDTPTLVALDASGQAAKDAREAAALERIRSELGPDSLVVGTIERFEAQKSREARWVRHLDKCMPKLTHALNGGAAIRAQGVTLEATTARVAGQIAEARRVSPDLPEAAEIAADLWRLVQETWTETEKETA